jgi:hypothetical protein
LSNMHSTSPLCFIAICAMRKRGSSTFGLLSIQPSFIRRNVHTWSRTQMIQEATKKVSRVQCWSYHLSHLLLSRLLEVTKRQASYYTSNIVADYQGVRSLFSSDLMTYCNVWEVTSYSSKRSFTSPEQKSKEDSRLLVQLSELAICHISCKLSQGTHETGSNFCE